MKSRSKSLVIATALLAMAASGSQITYAHAQQKAVSQQGTMMGQGGNMQGGGMNQGGMKQGGNMGPGGMKQGGKMGPGGMMHGGKMGPGGMMGMMMKMRKKMMGKMFMVRQKAYSNEDIKRMIDGRLAMHGFSRLKAGAVKDGANKNQNAALVDVVSGKGEFLFQVMVNRKSGMAAIVK